MRCPHCKSSDDVILDVKLEYDPTKQEEFWGAFDKEVKRLRKLLPDSRNELVAFLFKNAMDVRYEHPKRSHQLFHEVIALKPQHWESRIKLSWLEIRFNNFLNIIPLLDPIIASSSSATIEQKQRAYNNIVCSYLFRLPSDIISAEKFAKKGIDLEPTGNVKLWENYGTVLLQQGRLVEAREAYQQALELDPNSEFTLASLNSLKNMDKKSKNEKMMEKKKSKKNLFAKENKENVEKTSKNEKMKTDPYDMDDMFVPIVNNNTNNKKGTLSRLKSFIRN